jgi:hypothetical protein
MRWFYSETSTLLFLLQQLRVKLSTMCRHLHLLGRISLGVSIALLAASAHAYQVNIAPGARAIYLQVGVGGALVGGATFSTGGTPTSNATVNQVSVNVPAASVGAGTRAMTSNSTVINSPYDGFLFCTLPQVYVGGYFRAPTAGANGTLTATVPTNLTSGANTIPFSQISWVSGGNGDVTPTIPSGTFVGGSTQTIFTVVRNTWFESCLQFNYANTALPAAGTFNGTVVYTLTAP